MSGLWRSEQGGGGARAVWPGSATGTFWSIACGEPDLAAVDAIPSVGWWAEPFLFADPGTITAVRFVTQNNGASAAANVGVAVWDADSRALLGAGVGVITAGYNGAVVVGGLSIPVGCEAYVGLQVTAGQNLQRCNSPGPLPGVVGTASAPTVVGASFFNGSYNTPTSPLAALTASYASFSLAVDLA